MDTYMEILDYLRAGLRDAEAKKDAPAMKAWLDCVVVVARQMEMRTATSQDLHNHIDGKLAQCCGRCEWFNAIRDCSGTGHCRALVPVSVGYPYIKYDMRASEGADCECFKERV